MNDGKPYIVPADQRYLILKGIVDEDVRKQLNNFGSAMGPTEVCLFLSFAYDDIPVGTIYDVVFPFAEPDKYVETKVELKAVTQQFALEVDEIPSGWKTICIFDFPDGIPEMIRNLPIVETWYQIEMQKYICICHKEDYDEVKKSVESFK